MGGTADRFGDWALARPHLSKGRMNLWKWVQGPIWARSPLENSILAAAGNTVCVRGRFPGFLSSLGFSPSPLGLSNRRQPWRPHKFFTNTGKLRETVGRNLWILDRNQMPKGRKCANQHRGQFQCPPPGNFAYFDTRNARDPALSHIMASGSAPAGGFSAVEIDAATLLGTAGRLSPITPPPMGFLGPTHRRQGHIGISRVRTFGNAPRAKLSRQYRPGRDPAAVKDFRIRAARGGRH